MGLDSRSNYFTWVVAYIDSEYLSICRNQLSKYPEYKEITPFIPTIKVFKKQFKNKNYFEDVPLLFQYGFFQIPRKYAIHPVFLESLQKNISCIYGWVKDPLKVMKNTGAFHTDCDIPVATASSQEIAEIIRASINLGAHSSDDLDLINIGDYITLKGYPWDGVEAEFLGIDEKKNKVKVRMLMFNRKKEMLVPFEVVYFNLYNNKGYDETINPDKVREEAGLDWQNNKKRKNAQD